MGNKVDLEPRAIPQKRAQAWVEGNDGEIATHYIETSAKDNINVTELFRLVAEQIVKQKSSAGVQATPYHRRLRQAPESRPRRPAMDPEAKTQLRDEGLALFERLREVDTAINAVMGALRSVAVAAGDYVRHVEEAIDQVDARAEEEDKREAFDRQRHEEEEEERAAAAAVATDLPPIRPSNIEPEDDTYLYARGGAYLEPDDATLAREDAEDEETLAIWEASVPVGPSGYREYGQVPPHPELNRARRERERWDAEAAARAAAIDRGQTSTPGEPLAIVIQADDTGYPNLMRFHEEGFPVYRARPDELGATRGAIYYLVAVPPGTTSLSGALDTTSWFDVRQKADEALRKMITIVLTTDETQSFDTTVPLEDLLGKEFAQFRPVVTLYYHHGVHGAPGAWGDEAMNTQAFDALSSLTYGSQHMRSRR